MIILCATYQIVIPVNKVCDSRGQILTIGKVKKQVIYKKDADQILLPQG